MRIQQISTPWNPGQTKASTRPGAIQFLGLLAVAGVLAALAWRDAYDFSYYDRTRYLTYVGPIALALGTVVGGADDALNRFASTIPTSVAALLLAIIGLAALGGGFAASRR